MLMEMYFFILVSTLQVDTHAVDRDVGVCCRAANISDSPVDDNGRSPLSFQSPAKPITSDICESTAEPIIDQKVKALAFYSLVLWCLPLTSRQFFHRRRHCPHSSNGTPFLYFGRNSPFCWNSKREHS